MKLVIRIFVAMLCIASTSASALNVLPINWQLTKALVKEQLTLTLEEEHPTRLTYKTQLYGMPFHLEYVFDKEGKLNNLLYYHSVVPAEGDCVVKYDRLKENLIRQLGKTETHVDIYSEKAKEANANLCQFSATGEYQLRSQWIMSDDEIALVLNTWKGTPYIGVTITQQK